MTMKSLCLSLTFAAAGVAVVTGAAGRPMTIDDLITAVRVSEPDLSPDGKVGGLRQNNHEPADRPTEPGPVVRTVRRFCRTQDACSAATRPKRRRSTRRTGSPSRSSAFTKTDRRSSWCRLKADSSASSRN